MHGDHGRFVGGSKCEHGTVVKKNTTVGATIEECRCDAGYYGYHCHFQACQNGGKRSCPRGNAFCARKICLCKRGYVGESCGNINPDMMFVNGTAVYRNGKGGAGTPGSRHGKSNHRHGGLSGTSSSAAAAAAAAATATATAAAAAATAAAAAAAAAATTTAFHAVAITCTRITATATIVSVQVFNCFIKTTQQYRYTFRGQHTTIHTDAQAYHDAHTTCWNVFLHGHTDHNTSTNVRHHHNTFNRKTFNFLLNGTVLRQQTIVNGAIV